MNDDLLELFIRIIDPLVLYFGPHAVAAVAVIGAVATFFTSRKQRRREKRLESKIDAVMAKVGAQWSASKPNTSAYSAQKSSQSSLVDTSLVLFAKPFISQMRALKTTLRRVKKMSKTWLVGLFGYLAYFVKSATGYNIPDEMVNTIADIVLLAIPLVAMIRNMKKGEQPVEKPKIDDHEFVG